MSHNAIENKVVEIVSDQLGLSFDDVHPALSFSDDLGADDLDFVELLMAFEEEFEVEISDDIAERLEKVQDIIDFVSLKTN
ncbi:MAG: acyl carrier protein [Deltaproteobacteria bacterium]|nr:acyl carrier protein [Deltaproteobacteria bacterium]